MVKNCDLYKLPKDPNSFAESENVRTTHLEIDWTVDFNKKILTGFVILHFDVLNNDVKDLILDTRDLKITKVVCETSGQNLNYSLNKNDEKYGSKLSITLPSGPLEKKLSIRVFYSTSPSSSALQWLNPSQTAGKKHPYLYSQCQAIQARALLPCQDTPRIKATYSASVRCDSNLVVLMSALKEKEFTTEGEMTCYRFNQPVVIPSYLVAIVVGDLVCEDIGPRSKVWTERELLKKAAHEFTETEKMLSIAEEICGPYVWHQYDLLVLPPSFPYGGMENPCLTFVTPSILAGDRSLADVIAHEICHSWTGNLVTNCNWEHFWLNEGFTMFLERKILEKMKGKSARHLSAIEGWESLSYGIETIGKDNPTTFLVPNYEGVDPDEAYSVVPYEKGHSFLWYLESLLGGSEVFDPFLKAYIEKHHHQSIDTQVFKSFLLNYFSDKADVLKEVDWNEWLKTPGMPVYKPKFDTSLVDACIELCDKWVKWDVKQDCPFNKKDLEEFSSEQIIVLSDKVLGASLSIEKIQKMDEVYQFSDSQNAEIKFRWLRSCIKAKWIEKLDEIIKYLNTYGRMKYVKPLYKDLYDWEEARQKAIDNFNANKDSMMQIPIAVISKILHLSK